jgi:hypothetical protein
MRAPAGMPPSGNSKYVVIVIVLILATVALVAFKTCGGTPPPPPKPVSTFDAAPVSHEDDNVPLPPPPEQPVPDSGPGGRTVTIIDPCAPKTCSGTTTSDLETQVAYRAKQAHRCYDQALLQDSDLKGHVTLKVKIGFNGAMCSANVISNDMGTDSVANCVANTFRASKGFPKPLGNCVEMNVPISFISGK